MTENLPWLIALLVLVMAGEGAPVRLTKTRGDSPVSSAAAVALMLALPHRPGLWALIIPIAGVLAITVASLIGRGAATAAGLDTTRADVVGRVSISLAAGVLGQLIGASTIERTMGPDGRDWILALALWMAALIAVGVRVVVVAVWVWRSKGRSLTIALRDEARTFGLLSLASATTAVMMVLSEAVLGLWGPFLFALPLALSIAASRRYAQTRRTYRETITVLSRLTDLAGYTTKEHGRRVAEVAVALARGRGMTQRDVETVEYAALLHDLGQVALNEPIPGGATVLAAPRDQERIAADGVSIIRHSGVLDDAADLLTRQAMPYRNMREGDERIPLGSRIIKLANAFDDLTGGARDAAAVSVALERIQLGMGYEYDPALVDDLVALVTDGTPRSAASRSLSRDATSGPGRS